MTADDVVAAYGVTHRAAGEVLVRLREAGVVECPRGRLPIVV
jgi:hypothetical protein